ncbi:MAG: hypothetical protein AYK19_03950 [Theionarchaea archaeon DG-70-1]|nr:MAG: hypothetical protein AYK19_03950 [Theionarchaea archaeon DG-70-1]
MDLLGTVEDVVTFCENRGAEAEVSGIKTKEVIVAMERSDIKLCIKQNTTGVGIRTLIGNSMGFASCNSLDERITTETAEKAVSMSRKTPPLPFCTLASPGRLPDVPGLYDPEIQNIDEEDAISIAHNMITAIREDPRVFIDSGELSISVREKAISTSTGISAAEKKSRLSWLLIAIAREKDEVGSFEYEYGCTTKVKEVYAEETARMIAEKAAANLHPQKIESFSGDIILGPGAVVDLIVDPFVSSVNANNVYRGQSVLAQKLTEEVASDVVTIRDHAVLPGDFNASAFDREGTPHQNVTIVENGVLTQFMYDSLAANRENVSPTGNATGTVREIPMIGVTNFVVDETSRALDTIVEEADTGLLITRYSGTAERISGDFSGAVKGAQYIKSGEIQHPVKEAAIAGNIFEILPRITDVSEETLRYPKMVLPYMKIPEMQIIV